MEEEIAMCRKILDIGSASTQHTRLALRTRGDVDAAWEDVNESG